MKKKWIKKKLGNLNFRKWMGWGVVYLYIASGSMGFDNASVAQEVFPEKATLQRRYDAVIIKGESLGPVQGTPISGGSLAPKHPGKASPGCQSQRFNHIHRCRVIGGNIQAYALVRAVVQHIRKQQRPG